MSKKPSYPTPKIINPMKITPVKGDDPEGKHIDYSKRVYDDSNPDTISEN